MDRIDSYIQQAFAKFQDVPEIQAQKEEMADHLRDRVADAIGQGMGEKEAFASATAAMSDAMPDLEQTLAEFLRPEFRPEFQRGTRPKPHTKEIYINFYRYHRAMMLMFAQVLYSVVILAMSDYAWRVFDSDAIMVNLQGLVFWVNLFISFNVVYSIVSYLRNPLRIKQVSVSPWQLLLKFCIGAMIALLVPVNAIFLFFGPPETPAVAIFNFFFVVVNLLLYSVFFGVFTMLGWFRRNFYSISPNTNQDAYLVKWGVLLMSVFLFIFTNMMLMYMAKLSDFRIAEWSAQHAREVTNASVRPSEPYVTIQPRDYENLKDQLTAATGYNIRLPNDGLIMAEVDRDNPHPMDGMNPMSGRGIIPAKEGLHGLKNGMATNLIGAGGQRFWYVPGMREINYKIVDSRRSVPTFPGMGGFGPGGGGFEPPKLKEHVLTLDSDFPVTDLTDKAICARQFPFEEYKLGMIQAVAPETVADGETFPVRIGIGNLDARNAKLLLTLEYGDGLHQEAIPSGSTLFLGFLGSREYREYKADFTVVNSANNADFNSTGEHTLKLTLRNESGQVIAETRVVVNR